jgi:hypothetical protein
VANWELTEKQIEEIRADRVQKGRKLWVVDY